MRGPWPFVGRSQEFAHALTALHGSPRTGFVLVGPYGAGKRALLREVIKRLDQHQFLTIEVFGTDATMSIPLGAFASLMPPEMMAAGRAGELLAQALTLIRTAAAGRVVVLAIANVHLLDPLGAAFVYQAVRDEHACLAATRCPGEPVHDAISALWHEDRVTSITLRPLGNDAVRLLLAQVLGGQVDRVTAHRLWQLSEGNALLLRMIVDELLEQNAFESQWGVWHWTGDTTGLVTSTTETIAAKLDQIPASVRRVIELVALAEQVSRDTAVDVTSETAVHNALRTRLIKSHHDRRRTTLQMTRPIDGDVVKRRLSDHDRRAYITSLAARVQSYGARRSVDLMCLGRWHLNYGVPVHVSILTAAARLAYAAHDLRLASALAQAAVDGGGGFDAIELLASAKCFTGDPDAAIALLDTVSLSLLGEAEQIRFHMIRAFIDFIMRHQVGAVEELALAVEQLHTPDRDVLVALAACLRFSRGDFADGWAELMTLLSDGTSTLPAHVHAAAMAAAIAAARGEVGAADRILTVEAQVPALEPTWPTLRAAAEFARWIVAFVTGQLPVVVPETAANAIRLFPLIDTQALLTQAVSLRRRGHLTAAAETAAVARLLADAGGHIFVCAAIAEVACTAALLGDVDAATAAMVECDQRYRQTMALHYPMIELARVQVAATGTDLAEAEGLARTLAVRLRDDGLHGFEVHALHALTRLGRSSAADTARLAELATKIPEALPVAMAQHADAWINDSATGLAQACQEFAALDLRLFALEAAAQRYDLLRHRRDQGVGEAADDLLALLGDCEASCLPALRLPLPSLTNREQDVADLVERGLDAAKLAATLVIDKRTVDTHLLRIYKKLGAHSLKDVPGIVRLSRFLRIHHCAHYGTGSA